MFQFPFSSFLFHWTNVSFTLSWEWLGGGGGGREGPSPFLGDCFRLFFFALCVGRVVLICLVLVSLVSSNHSGPGLVLFTVYGAFLPLVPVLSV